MANQISWPLQFLRQFAGSLDADYLFDTVSAKTNYLTSARRYEFQVIACKEDQSVSVINNAKDAYIDIILNGELVGGQYSTFTISPDGNNDYELTLDKNKYANYAISSPLNFTLAGSGNKTGIQANIVITADGTNKPTFDSNYTIVFDDYNNTNGEKNLIIVKYLDSNNILVDIRQL